MRYLLLLCLPLVAQVQTPLTVYQSSGTATGEIRLQERRTNGTNHVGLAAPQSVAADLVWTLPATDGTNGQALVTNGSGVLSWSTAGGLPVADTSAVVQGSGDATKLLRFEIDGFSTATTRVLTPQNASYTLAGTDLAQTFTATQSIEAQLWVNAGNSLIMNRATRGTNQKAYWVVAGNAATTGAWSIGTTPSGVASRFVVDHNNTEHFVVGENGSIETTAGANFNGIVSTTTFNATGNPAYRVSGTTVIDSSRNASIVGLTINGTITGDLIPSTSNLYTNGSSTSYWNMVRTESIRTHGGNVQPATSLSGSLGASTGRWLKTWTQDLDITGTIIPPSGTAFTGTKTVRAAGGASDCTLTFSAGIMTGGTC